jgi:hypothetical protein
MNRLLVLLILLISRPDISAQTAAFDSLYHRILFNMYSGKPDSVVVPFLKSHFPYLVKQHEPGGWTIYPPGNTALPQKGFHAVKLDHHPLIRQVHSGARLDIFSQEWPVGNPGIEKTRVWIYFPDKKSAVSVLDSLIADFKLANAIIQPVGTGTKNKVRIRPGMSDDEVLDITFQIKKMATDQFAILILFTGDNGEPW